MNNKIMTNDQLPMNNKKNLKAFTLLETLVAIFIFTLAVTAVLSLVGDSVNSSNSLKDDITASYLADEAMDYIRGDRDTIAFQKVSNSAVATADWQGFIEKYGYPSSSCFSSNGCEMDILSPNTSIAQCLSTDCSLINFYDSNNTKYYGLTGAGMGTPEKTKFRRRIQFFTPSSSVTDKVLVKVTVSWKNRSGLVRTKVYYGALYNWGA